MRNVFRLFLGTPASPSGRKKAEASASAFPLLRFRPTIPRPRYSAATISTPTVSVGGIVRPELTHMASTLFVASFIPLIT